MSAIRRKSAVPAPELVDRLHAFPFSLALEVYRDFLNDPRRTDVETAYLAEHDRYFLLTQILGRSDMLHPWLYDRTREVEADPDGNLDLWAREHYKSTIITFGGSFQEIIASQGEITIGLFAHTRIISKAFLSQIKQESETNILLFRFWPDVFWANPKKESPRWSLDEGLVFKRRTNPKESTVEAWGLVDSQPTSKHFELMIYDDMVSRESVTTPEQIIKTTQAWELSRFLSAQREEAGRRRPPRTWYIGTRYNFADTYHVIIDRKAARPRLHPATEDGTRDGRPVFLDPEAWEKIKRETSEYTLACQMLQNPIGGTEQEFKPEWIRRWEVRPQTLNVAILVDPASSRKKGTSNSAFAVIGMDAARNKYLLDGACHKMNLTERWEMLKRLRNKWLREPGVQVVRVGYEKYGMQADIEHFQEMMRIEKQVFPIEPVSWTKDTDQSKDDRIRRLIPDHQNWRFFYPYDGQKTRDQASAETRGQGALCARPIRRKNHEGLIYDLVEWFLQNEYLFFPATTAKDFLDAMSRFYDLEMNPPQVVREADVLPEYEGDF